MGRRDETGVLTIFKISSLFTRGPKFGSKILKADYFNTFSMHLLVKKASVGLGGSVGSRPTGDQEVAGSTPTEVGNILSWFSTVILSLPLIQEGQFLAKEYAQYW